MFLGAGCDKCDITTEDPSVRVNDPLYARTLVFDDGLCKTVIISMDCIAIGDIGEVGDMFFPALRTRLAADWGIEPDRILIGATHTHVPGPMVCDDTARLERISSSVGRAIGGITPCRLGSAVGCDDSFIINRTLRMKDGSAWSVRQAHPCPPDREIAGLEETDSRIGIVRIDRVAGGTLAVLFVFGCHPLVGLPDNSVSAQFPGFAVRTIEEGLGDGAMALFLQGTGGDVTEILYKETNRPKNCEAAGISLGLNTLRAARLIKTEDAAVNVAARHVEFPRRRDYDAVIASLLEEREALLAGLPGISLNFKTFLPLYIKYLTGGDYPLDYAYAYMKDGQTESALRAQDKTNRKNIEKYLAGIETMERLVKNADSIATLKRHKSHIASGHADILGIKLGDFVIVSAPLEALTEIGQRVRAVSPYEKTFIASLSNGYMHYGAPARVYNNGGYETIESMLDEGWQEIYENAAADIVSRL